MFFVGIVCTKSGKFTLSDNLNSSWLNISSKQYYWVQLTHGNRASCASAQVP